MSRVQFDFARLRKNWDRARVEPSAQNGTAAGGALGQARLSPKAAPELDDTERIQAQVALLDEQHTIEMTWQQVKSTIARDYAAHTESLAVFVSEVDRLLASTNSIALPEPKLRLELEAALADLEDLLEVFGGYGYP